MGIIALDVIDEAWRRKRAGFATRLYRTRRDLILALEHEGGVSALIRESLPGRKEAVTPPG